MLKHCFCKLSLLSQVDQEHCNKLFSIKIISIKKIKLLKFLLWMQLGDYNLQCNVDKTRQPATPKRPFYCQFIPFFNYKKRWHHPEGDQQGIYYWAVADRARVYEEWLCV